MLSYFLPPITNTRPARNVTLGEVYEMIVSEKWAQTTQSLRSLHKEAQSGFKQRQLPFVTFSGTFTQRHNEYLVRHSGLMCLDFDHVGDEASVRALQELLVADHNLEVQLAFRSPSGDGLKVIVKNDFTPKEHNTQYAQLAQYIQQNYNITVDHTNDIARACFLCHDTKAYYNAKFKMHNTPLKEVELPIGEKRVEMALHHIEQQGIDITARYHDWYRIGMALASHYGEAGRDYYHRLSRFYPRYTIEETNKQYDRCLRYNTHRIHIGTLLYLIRSTVNGQQSTVNKCR